MDLNIYTPLHTHTQIFISKFTRKPFKPPDSDARLSNISAEPLDKLSIK